MTYLYPSVQVSRSFVVFFSHDILFNITFSLAVSLPPQTEQTGSLGASVTHAYITPFICSPWNSYVCVRVRVRVLLHVFLYHRIIRSPFGSGSEPDCGALTAQHERGRAEGTEGCSASDPLRFLTRLLNSDRV